MWIAIVVAVLVLGVLAFAATRPDNFHVERQISIKAPPATIYPLIADFHRWTGWSPYEKLDPAMARTYGGPESGVGAVYGWDGKKVGSGRMEIVDVVQPSKVVIKLDFTKPMTAHNTAAFTLVPSGDLTTVTWNMDGPSPYVSKLMGLVFNMDQLVGKDFETGLANLKAAAER
jgi:uncharacterized protein YndB with AHSA1/START domain